MHARQTGFSLTHCALRAFCLFTFASCASVSPVRPDVVTLGMRIEGRSQLTQDGNGTPHVRIAYSNTSLSWRAHGDSMWICAQDFGGEDANHAVPVANEYAVEMDGTAYPLFHPPLEAGCHAVARGLTPDWHTVRLTKRTEASVGETVFSRPLGPLAAPPMSRSRKILAIGDSITCGYGVLTSNPHQHFDPRLEDGTRSYVALAGKAVSASVETIAYSGRGVWRNRDGSSDGTLVQLFARALPSTNDQASHKSHADVVVINLGTNDAHAGPVDFAAYERAYRQLLALVDADAPQALTVLALGPMISNEPSPTNGAHLHDTFAALLQSIATQRTAHGQRTVAIAFPPQDEPPYSHLGLGGDYHPALSTQRDMAARLVEVLQHELSW